MPAPNSYRPDKPLGNQGVPKYSMGKRLPGKIERLEKQSFLPSPFEYSVKTNSVLPTKFNKIGFGYGTKTCAKDNSKLSPGPGDYNLSSFTDKFKPSLFRQTRKVQTTKKSYSVAPSPRQCSLAKPLSGGIFDPNGVVKKEKTPGFNYPPVKMSKYMRSGNTMFYKTEGFKADSSMQRSFSPEKPRNSQEKANNGYDKGSAGSENSNSISNM